MKKEDEQDLVTPSYPWRNQYFVKIKTSLCSLGRTRVFIQDKINKLDFLKIGNQNAGKLGSEAPIWGNPKKMRLFYKISYIINFISAILVLSFYAFIILNMITSSVTNLGSSTSVNTNSNPTANNTPASNPINSTSTVNTSSSTVFSPTNSNSSNTSLSSASPKVQTNTINTTSYSTNTNTNTNSTSTNSNITVNLSTANSSANNLNNNDDSRILRKSSLIESGINNYTEENFESKSDSLTDIVLDKRNNEIQNQFDNKFLHSLKSITDNVSRNFLTSDSSNKNVTKNSNNVIRNNEEIKESNLNLEIEETKIIKLNFVKQTSTNTTITPTSVNYNNTNPNNSSSTNTTSGTNKTHSVDSALSANNISSTNSSINNQTKTPSSNSTIYSVSSNNATTSATNNTINNITTSSSFDLNKCLTDYMNFIGCEGKIFQDALIIIAIYNNHISKVKYYSDNEWFVVYFIGLVIVGILILINIFQYTDILSQNQIINNKNNTLNSCSTTRNALILNLETKGQKVTKDLQDECMPIYKTIFALNIINTICITSICTIQAAMIFFKVYTYFLKKNLQDDACATMKDSKIIVHTY